MSAKKITGCYYIKSIIFFSDITCWSFGKILRYTTTSLLKKLWNIIIGAETNKATMRIVHLAAGAGAMYCGACTRDMSLVRGLLSLGHDIQVLPLYTPPARRRINTTC